MVVAPLGVDMAPEHSRETLDFDEFVAGYSGAVPQWKARRLAISMSHSDTITTKILEF
jgi:hypothetical protein